MCMELEETLTRDVTHGHHGLGVTHGHHFDVLHTGKSIRMYCTMANPFASKATQGQRSRKPSEISNSQG